MVHSANPALLWWQRGVVYQIYPRSFMDSNHDGIGDLDGIVSKLDYVRDLGVDAIWLSPFYPSPMIESRASRTNPKRDWYVWRDAKPDGGLPNNWLSVFGGPAWELDAVTGQYYLHSFLSEQPDLNWRNPEVKAAMLDAVRFWLDRGVDGFRIDVAHFIMKDPDLRDNPPSPDANKPGMHRPMGAYDSQLHLYDKGHLDVHAAFREFRALLDSYSVTQPRYSVGEIHIFDWKEWATYYGENGDELHMPFNFALIGARWDASVIRGIVEAIEATLPAWAWPNYVMSNHDEHRIASRWGADTARTAMMLLLTLRGTPTMYYGDELGMHDGVILPEQEQDPFGKRVPGLALGRDPERTPMQWDSSANAGFSSAQVKPWLPVAAGYDQINVAREAADSHSTLALTRRLLALRRATPALHGGEYRTIPGAPDDCYLYERTGDGQRFLISLNFSDAARTLTLNGFDSARLLLSTQLDREGAVDLAAFTLRPYEGCLFAL